MTMASTAAGASPTELDELRATVRRFLADKAPESHVRSVMTSDHGIDAQLWRELAQQLGLQGLALPEAYGGAGYGYVEQTVVLEELGRALTCVPYFGTVVLAANALLESGDTGAMGRWLPAIAAGELTATLAVGEPITAEPAIAATQVGESWQLDGTVSHVVDGMSAELLLVFGRTAKGLGLFALDAGTSGVVRTHLPTMDLTRKQAAFAFAHAPATLVGADDDGERILTRVLQLAAIALAAEQVGGAQRCLELATEYARTRIQFGRAIGSFQAVKHRCADLLVGIELARSAAARAAVCAAENDADLALMASLAKSFCSTTFVQAATDNIQLHGGIGFTWEHPAHLYLKRAKSGQLLFGGPALHRERVARALGL
ncbi:acyl-CoA dehydrogenase family protein [Kribbella sp. NPDC051586]|uniref:acyl-CoA dehydrogenase family protein n=1 Tax=Kribbella sp. NPDC051586 TaxID=3364118 RepID=UPI0037961FA9